MKTRSILTALLCFTGLTALHTALATPITFHFEGTVDFVQGELAGELLAPGWTADDLLGTDFHGSYTFDADATDASANPQVGSYPALGAPFGMEFHFDHRSFFFEGITIGITNDVDLPASVTPGLLDDIYAAQSVPSPHPSNPLLSLRGRLDLLSTGTDTVGPGTLTSDSLLLQPPDITAFDQGRVFVNALRLEEDEDGRTVSRVRGGIGGSLRVLRVPEPSTLLLLGIGLIGLAAARRKKGHDAVTTAAS